MRESIHGYLGGGSNGFFEFHPYLGKIPIVTSMFLMGWNHQLVLIVMKLSSFPAKGLPWFPIDRNLLFKGGPTLHFQALAIRFFGRKLTYN